MIKYLYMFLNFTNYYVPKIYYKIAKIGFTRSASEWKMGRENPMIRILTWISPPKKRKKKEKRSRVMAGSITFSEMGSLSLAAYLMMALHHHGDSDSPTIMLPRLAHLPLSLSLSHHLSLENPKPF